MKYLIAVVMLTVTFLPWIIAVYAVITYLKP